MAGENMAIMIDGYNKTDYVKQGSFTHKIYGVYRSECSFILEFDDGVPENLAVGMEVKIHRPDATLIWGGIIDKLIYRYRTSDFVSVLVSCKGYEMIVPHKAVRLISGTYQNSRALTLDCVEDLFDNEGIYVENDNISKITVPKTVTYRAMSLDDVLSDIANYYGMFWWITPEKDFYFKDVINLSSPVRNYDMTDSTENKIIDIAFCENIEDFRNYQYVRYDGGSSYAMRQNSASIDEMSQYFGTGEYMKVTPNPNITTSGAATSICDKLLTDYAKPPRYVKMTVKYDDLKLFDVINIKRPSDSGFEKYMITETDVFYKGNVKLMTVFARAHASNTYIPLANSMKNFTFNV